MSEIVIAPSSVKDRLRAAFDELMANADLPKPLMTLGAGFFDNFINNTEEEKIAAMLVLMRDDLIPFILGDYGHDQS